MFLIPSEARWVRLRNSRIQAEAPLIPGRYMDLRRMVVGEFKPLGVHVPHDPFPVIWLWPQPIPSSLKVWLSVTRCSPFEDTGVLSLALADSQPRFAPIRGSFGTWWVLPLISQNDCGPVKTGRALQQSPFWVVVDASREQGLAGEEEREKEEKEEERPKPSRGPDKAPEQGYLPRRAIPHPVEVSEPSKGVSTSRAADSSHQEGRPSSEGRVG